ncbi:MAG: hypothetical protein ACMXYF_02320 [Candidatus Woesearchaeota archaeon]
MKNKKEEHLAAKSENLVILATKFLQDTQSGTLEPNLRALF